MIAYRPTPLDLALAENPIAEADSRAVAAAATPPDWARLDSAANLYAAAFEEGRRRLASDHPAQEVHPPGLSQASAA